MLIFRDKKLRNSILKIAAPAMTEMVLYMVIGVVDVAVVGRLGATPLAAVGLGAELFFSVILFLSALGVGSSILVAQAKGAGKMEQAGRIAGQTFVIGLIVGLAAAYLGVSYAENILGLFAIEKDVYNQAIPYLKITFFISPFALTHFMINSIFRGLGRTDIPMKIALITNVINVTGDIILVYGLLGFPALGVAGAAWATAAAQVTGFILSSFILLYGRSELRLELKSLYTIYLPAMRGIFRLGVPSLAEQFFNTIAHLLSVFLIVYMGTLAYASHQIALTVESVSFMPGMGVAIAATTMVGQAVGAGKREDILLASRGCLELIMVFMGLIGIVFALFPYFIASLFTNERQIIEIAGFLIRLAAFEQLTVAASMVLGGILKGSGNTRTPMYIITGFTWLFKLPMMYVIIRILAWPIAWVWAMFIIDWALRALVFTIIYRKKKWLATGLDNTAISKVGEDDH